MSKVNIFNLQLGLRHVVGQIVDEGLAHLTARNVLHVDVATESEQHPRRVRTDPRVVTLQLDVAFVHSTRFDQVTRKAITAEGARGVVLEAAYVKGTVN